MTPTASDSETDGARLLETADRVASNIGNGRETVVRAPRRCTIVEAEALRGDLLARLRDDGEHPIAIDLSQVEEADITLVQLVLSAELTARARGRELTVASSPVVDDLWSRAGLPGLSAPSGP